MARSSKRQEILNIALIVAALALVVVIVWIDITTGIWQDLVILAGVAAGFVSFVLTVVVLNRMTAKATARRWAPVNRLALSDFLYALADEEQSDISRGTVVPRMFAFRMRNVSKDEAQTMLQQLHLQVVTERTALADSLSRWAEVLSATGVNEQVMLHIADYALGLDKIRDAAVELEDAPGDEQLTKQLHARLGKSNDLLQDLVAELQQQLKALDNHV